MMALSKGVERLRQEVAHGRVRLLSWKEAQHLRRELKEFRFHHRARSAGSAARETPGASTEQRT